jgi:phosphatidylserine/phosphatidylglycerophosphate/cardiolipin synthase-like enzyme
VATDGNNVTPLVDGKDYMRVWREDLLALYGMQGAEFYHAGWRFEDLKTLGATEPGGSALDAVVGGWREGVGTYVMACRNLRCLRFNGAAVRRLRLEGVRTAFLDSRFPPGGSNHQKFSVMRTEAGASAILGSVDIARTRWDSQEHFPVDPNRDPKYGRQTHEVAVRVEGPAVTDLEKTFRQRWNDPTRVLGLLPPHTVKPLIATPFSALAGHGPHSVQVLRTYGITSSAFGYSWSRVGEFTVWASHLNAIKKAASSIYIEEQYFLPFGWPPYYARDKPAREIDLIYQLGEAMKRGVNVAVVVPAKPTGVWRASQKYQRDVGVNYLRNIRRAGSAGDVVIASLQSDGSDVYVHSKLMIVDDQFISIGSANMGLRSMTYDSELQVGIVDETNLLARQFRTLLMAEHTGLPAGRLLDMTSAFDLFGKKVASESGHLKPYPVDPDSVYPTTATSALPRQGHASFIRRGFDPCGGPHDLG